ncbi:MAG: hypothetical protein AAGJ89_17885 [Pseudomonadota bacterium]
MSELRNIFWDSCILYRFLRGKPLEYVDHIKMHVEDCEAGKTKIYISSVALAELRPSVVGMSGHSPASIVSQMCAFAVAIDASPNIMSFAGALKDNKFVCSTDHPKADERLRPLSTGDAIQLATAVSLREHWGVIGLEFHTFDEGKRASKEDGGKTVPMIGFHNWCEGLDHKEEVSLVREMKRSKPEHPLCPLPKKSPNLTASKKPPAS